MNRPEIDSRIGHPLVIVGPTASGKSSLATAVARELKNVEIVAGDSMQIYQSMNIGTATPTADEQAEIPHHLINLVGPDREYSLGDFQRAAQRALSEIEERGNLAIVVGGTGLYIQAIVDALELPGRYPNIRAALEADPNTEALYAELLAADPEAAARMEPTNRRRLIRALEVVRGSGRPFSGYGPGLDAYPATRFVLTGLRWPREVLLDRIEQRYRQQIADGFLEEVRALDMATLSRTAQHALGYRELLAHLRGDSSLDAAIEEAVIRTRRFARRQNRWFGRDPRITWFDGPAVATQVIEAWTEGANTKANEPRQQSRTNSAQVVRD